MKPRFKQNVERLREYVERHNPEMLTLTDISAILGVSPNYAREIAKLYAEMYGGIYMRGVLYLGRKAESGGVEA